MDGARSWDGSIPVGFAESLKDPFACEIGFSRGRPTGEHAGLCADVAAAKVSPTLATKRRGDRPSRTDQRLRAAPAMTE